MKIRKRWVILGAVVLAVLAAGGWYRHYTTTDEYKARQLVAELRELYTGTGPGPIRQWLIDRGLMEEKKSRDEEEIIIDLLAIGEPAVPALIEALEDKDSDMRAIAALVLGLIGPEAKESVSALIRLLESEFVDEEGDVWNDDGEGWNNALDARCRAAEALGNIGLPAKAAVPALIKVLKDENEDNIAQEDAAWALGRMGPVAKEAVPALAHALKSGDNGVRSGAAWAMGEISPAPKEAIPALIEALKDEHSDVRHIAAVTLGQIAPAIAVKEAVPVLIKDLKDKDAEVRYWAAVALVNIAPATAAEKTVPILRKGLENPNEWVHGAAVGILGKIGSTAEEAISALRELLKDEDEGVRRAAAEALKKIEAKTEAE